MDKQQLAIKNAKKKATLTKNSNGTKPLPKIPTYEKDEDDSERSDSGSSLDEEDLEDYKEGGYYFVKVGEIVMDKFEIIRKLGWGHFSTVWLAKDIEDNKYYALKILKSAKQYTEAALDEIELLKKLTTSSPDHIGKEYTIQLHQSSSIIGPNGKHIVMVFEVLGENLLGLIRRHPKGIDTVLVKQIIKQVLMGLSYMHEECGVIHTDLKPENVLICLDNIDLSNKINDNDVDNNKDKDDNKYNDNNNNNNNNNNDELVVESLPFTLNDTFVKDENKNKLNNIKVKIADLGNACWVDHHFTDSIQTRQYRSPEVIVKGRWNESTDLWSLACMTFELLTGDFLFEPHNGRNFDKNDDHLAQMVELLGPVPRAIHAKGELSSDFFNRKGELRRISKLRPWRLDQVLVEKYYYTQKEADLLSSFLLPMLRYRIDERPKAKELINHAWLDI